MIRLQQVKCPVSHTEEELICKLCHLLHITEAELVSYKIIKRSIDARKKPELYYSYTVDCQVAKEKKCRRYINGKTILLAEPKRYRFPKAGNEKLEYRPVIAGSGPAGLFCAYMLALHGYRPLVFERGDEAAVRKKKVDTFWESGLLDPNSNVQFGEGGAGTFSDGKLNTSVKDPYGRNHLVLETFVKFGAPVSITYDQKPHLGTDMLIGIVENMRREIIRLGGSVCFQSQVTGIETENGRLQAVLVNHTRRILTNVLVIAIGHSARDTFAMLHRSGVFMEPKSFAVGVRVEHPQKLINLAQYGTENPGPLGAAPYKVTHQLKNGRGIYSFCMCPGGYVVNASSEPGRLAVNGMSYQARDSKNANSALIVTVGPEDYAAFAKPETPEALKGLDFQRALEERAFRLCRGRVPVQLYEDFRARRESKILGEVSPCIKGAWELSNLREILPPYLGEAIDDGIKAFGEKIKGYDRPDCLIDGIESRTSSPVRICRSETFESSIAGIYPCGEGGGYAGGITSAAMDGIRVAEAICGKFCSLL